MALRLEIRKNYRGTWDVREGDLSGPIDHYNLTEEGVIEEIRYLLKNYEKTEEEKK